MPSRQTVNRWMAQDADFASRIARAREVQGDCVFDDIGEIERKLLVGEITSDVARTLIWSKQWRAAKLAQKRYGDKLDTSGTVMLDMFPPHHRQVEGKLGGAEQDRSASAEDD